MLDWTAESGLESNLLDWIVIDNQNLIFNLDCKSSFSISIHIHKVQFFSQKIKIPKWSSFYLQKKVAVVEIFLKIVRLWIDLNWIFKPFWKLYLVCQWHICDGIRLDWQSKEMNWVTAWFYITSKILRTPLFWKNDQKKFVFLSTACHV